MHDRLRKAALALLVLASLAAAVKLLRYHYDLVVFPWPIQFRETAILLTTDLLLKGGNPFLIANQPEYTNVYGMIYNCFVYPFAVFFGPTLTLHKAVAGMFTLGCCLLQFHVMRRKGVPWHYSLAGALVFYAALLYGKTSLAEPDSTGTFFYLLTGYIPWLMGFSRRSLILSILCGIVAFYTKPYFVLMAPCVASYLFFFVSRKEGVLYSFAFIALFSCSVLGASQLFETYFYNTFLVHANYSGADTDHLLGQLKEFCRFNRELILAGAVGFATWIYRRRRCAETNATHRDPDGGTEPQASCHQEWRPAAFPLFVFLVLLVYFCLDMGQRYGAYMTYLYQLIIPFSLMIIFRAARPEGRNYLLIVPLLMASLYTTASTYGDISRNFSAHDHGDWQTARSLITTHGTVLASSALAPLLFARNMPVYDSGQTECFGESTKKPPKYPALFPLTGAIRNKFSSYRSQIAAGIINQRFDLIMFDRMFSSWLLPPDFRLDSYYDYRQMLVLYMPHTEYSWEIDVWERKKVK
jgi:hypothetical protein